MKKIVRYVWIILALFLVWGCYRAVRARSKLVTLKVDDVELREVIRKLEWQTWENILVHRDVQGRITLDVKSTPLPEVLEMIARQAHCRSRMLHPLYSSRGSLSNFKKGVRGQIDPVVPGWSDLTMVVYSPLPPLPPSQASPPAQPLTLDRTNCRLTVTARA